jgi:hypothetical protein
MFEKRYTLLHSQKTRVYEILREVGLEPAQFLWSSETIAAALTVSRLTHRDDLHYFQFSSFDSNAACTACPGMYRTTDDQHPKDWQEQEQFFRQWAQCLKNELHSPDLWPEVARHRLALVGEPSGEMVNEPIPAVQADQIGVALVRLADAVAQDLSLTDRRALLVRAKLAYLADAARRQRRGDWMHLVLGVWTCLVASLSLTEEQTARLQAMAQAEFGSLVSLAHPKLQAPSQPGRRILGIWPIASRASDKQAPAKSYPA